MSKKAITRNRQSGIELLKIFAIMIIALSHATQTLCSPHPILPSIAPNYFIPEAWRLASSDISHIILLIFGNLGNLGNNIFFIGSAWFLCSAAHSHKNKVLYLLADVWVISAIYLALFSLFKTPVPPPRKC